MPTPWRVSPFKPGKPYRVLSDFSSRRDSFRRGEVLTFKRDAYSIYDNCTGYFFSEPGREQPRVWDIYDDDDLEIWQALFMEENE